MDVLHTACEWPNAKVTILLFCSSEKVSSPLHSRAPAFPKWSIGGWKVSEYRIEQLSIVECRASYGMHSWMRNTDRTVHSKQIPPPDITLQRGSR